MSDVRPLPARPSLEFERKAAKALLAALRSDDADAWSRARAIDARLPTKPKLADAQRVVAREYGFVSWARLVRYFEVAERAEGGGLQRPRSRAYYESSAESFLKSFAMRRDWAADAVTAWIPRFYGRRSASLWTQEITLDEARLITARTSGFLSWDALMMVAPANSPSGATWEESPRERAYVAMRRLDLTALKAIVAEQPESAQSTAREARAGDSLISAALDLEAVHGREAMAPIVAWLVAQGFSVEAELHGRLWRRFFMDRSELQRLLDRGLDVERTESNGIPILELALWRMWSTESIDLLASHTKPRRALWIAAGLDDLRTLRSFFDGRGQPTTDAYAIRPAWEVAHQGLGWLPAAVDPTAEDLLFEALLAAVINQRVAAIRLLVGHGAPINRLWGDMSMLAYAVGNSKNPQLVQCLLDLGADPDLSGRGPSQSARGIARFVFMDGVPREAIREEIARIVGWDTGALLEERRRTLALHVPIDQRAQQAIALATDDAMRCGDDRVRPINLLFGAARSMSGELLRVSGGVDGRRFASAFRARLDAPPPEVPHELSASDATQRVVERARAFIRDQLRTEVGVSTLILALLDETDVATLLREYGADIGELRAQFTKF